MSQRKRIVHWMFACSAVLPGFQVADGEEFRSPAEITATAHSVDAIEMRYSQAGLIRILQEDVSNEGGPSSIRPLAVQEPKGLIELAPLGTPNTQLEGIGTGVRPEDVTIDRLPPALPLPTGETRDGFWGLQSKVWVPGGFCHQPLYFEDPMLERHGHVRFACCQPVASGLRFFATAPLLPYLATLQRPLDDVHTLGAYRPGTAAPTLRYRAHYDPAAIRNQAIATAASGVAIP